MGFIKQTASFDLGDTPIENIFINDFMPMANGTYVKVYLLGYKYAQDKDASLSVDNQTIAKHLNIPLSDVLSAWDFWEQKGIVVKHLHPENESYTYTVEFLNLKQLYINNNYKAVKVDTPADTSSSGTYTCSPDDLIEANKVPEIKEMFYQINQSIRRSLVPNEMMEILEWVYNYNMDPDMIVRSFMYCVEQKNIKNIKYVAAVVRNWYDNGITNTEKLDTYLEKTDGRYIQYKRIFQSMGFYRTPSQAEKETMDRWLDEWKFSMEVVLKACENTKRTNNPTIQYINGILLAWKNEGIQSIEDIEQKQVQEKPSPKKTAKTTTNRFHNFEQRTSKYTKDELEQLLRKKGAE